MRVMGTHPPIAADLLPVQLAACAGKPFGYSPKYRSLYNTKRLVYTLE